MEAGELDSWQTLTSVVAVLAAGIAGFALARLPGTGVRLPLFAFVISGVLWAIGDLIADGAADAVTKQIGIAVLYSGSISMPALWWIVVLRWSDEVVARLPLNAAAWRQVPLWWAGAMWLVMITNPWHGAFVTPVVGGRNVYHALWFAMTIPAYLQIFAAFALEIAVAHKVTRPAVRRQAGFLIAASCVTLLGNLLYITNLVPVNLTVVVLAISVSLLLVGMVREGLFGTMPMALRTIAAEHPDGLIVVNSHGHVDYANRRAHQLLDPIPLPLDLTEILEDPRLHPEIDPSFTPESSEDWFRALSGPTGVVYRVDAAAPRWLQVVISSIGGVGSDARGRVYRLSDVTKRRLAEAHAQRIRRLESVTALARAVSGDFQGDFTIIRANAELLADELADNSSQRHVARIFDATIHGTDLANRLRQYTGRIDPVRVTFELTEVVAEALNLEAAELAPSVRVQYRAPLRPLPVEADPIQVRECIASLLRNAIEATTIAGRQIDVTAGVEYFDPGRVHDLVCGADQLPGEYAFVQIRDEGGGMEPNVAERAFEPFFSTRNKERGSGLPTALGIARAHNAVVGLYNDPGWGCTFTVYFPLLPQHRPQHDD